MAERAGLLRWAESWARAHPWIIAGVSTLLTTGVVTWASYLHTENSYWRWVFTHRDYVRAAGIYSSRTESLRRLGACFFIVFLLAEIPTAIQWINPSAMGKGAWHNRIARVQGVCGGVILAFTLCLLTVWMKALVWEAYGFDSLYNLLLFTVPLAVMGGMLLTQTFVRRQVVLYGADKRKWEMPAPFGPKERFKAALLAGAVMLATLGFLPNWSGVGVVLNELSGLVLATGIVQSLRCRRPWVRGLLIFGSLALPILIFKWTNSLCTGPAKICGFGLGWIITIVAGIWFSPSSKLRDRADGDPQTTTDTP